MNNGIVLSATVTEPFTCSSFMPVSQIISHCAVLCTEVQFDYGADKVYIAVPLRRHYLFSNHLRQMNVGSNPAVGAVFFPARKTGVCYRYRAGVALGSQKQSIHA